MSGPKTTFDADECQSLLDLIDRASNRLTEADMLNTIDDLATEEEAVALAKLREAGKFYLPEKR